MVFDGRDTPILTFSKSKKYLKIFSPSYNIAINILRYFIGVSRPCNNMKTAVFLVL